MSQLLGILYKLRNFFLFMFLQVICFYLISKNSVYWDVTFFNTSNTAVAKSLAISQSIKEFTNLRVVNEQLAYENKKLHSDLAKANELTLLTSHGYKPDSSQASRFGFAVAKVISSTVSLADNYITIDKGTLDGLKPGMGVISPQGVVGQIMSCGPEFSRVSTILHSGFSVSAEVLNKKLRKENQAALGIGKWEGGSSRFIKLTTIDRFKSIFKGDSVVTSMQNAIFPPRLMIGRILRLSSRPSDAFYDVDVQLNTDFSSLVYVYIVNNKLLNQQEKLEVTPETK